MVGKAPSRGRVKRASAWAVELKDTISRVDSATADKVWKRSEASGVLWGVGVVGAGCPALEACLAGAWIEP